MATTLSNIGKLHSYGQITINSGGTGDVIVDNPSLIQMTAKYIPPPANPEPGPTYWINVLPIDDGSCPYHVDDFTYVYNTPADPTSGIAGIQFTIYSDAGPNGQVSYKVEVKARHSKTR